jgi:hypothetical protein
VYLTYVAQASPAVRDVHAAYVSSRHTYRVGWCQSELPYVNTCSCRVVMVSCLHRGGLVSYVGCLLIRRTLWRFCVLSSSRDTVTAFRYAVRSSVKSNRLWA